jgi:hypothetical protein
MNGTRAATEAEPIELLEALAMGQLHPLEALRGRTSPRSKLIAVLGKGTFALQGATGASQQIPLAAGIDIRRWKSAVLIIRMYDQTSWPAGATATISVGNDYIGQDDPGLELVERVQSQSVGSVSTPALILKNIDVSALGAQARVFLEAALSVTAGQQIFTLGVDLLGRFR